MFVSQTNKTCHRVYHEKACRDRKHLYEYLYILLQGLFRLRNLSGEVTFFNLSYSILVLQFNNLSRKS